MAIKSKLILTSDGGIDIEYPDAYFRIHKINTANADYEFFKNVNDPKRPDVEQELTWLTRYESSALVYVWSDEIARKNRASVLHWFNVDFDFDVNSNENIYQQAYTSLKTVFPDNEDC